MDAESRQLSYFEEIQEEVESVKKEHPVDSVERRQNLELVTQSALSECAKGPEATLCDASASKIIQSFFDDASWDALSDFLHSLCAHLSEICCKWLYFCNQCWTSNLMESSFSPFGSHVCEHLIMTIAGRHKPDQNDSYHQVMASVCEALEGSLGDWIVNRFATHIVRRLLCLLSGVDAISFIHESSAKHVDICTAKTDDLPKRTPELAVSGFDTLYFDLVDTIVTLVDSRTEVAMNLVFDQSSSPVLQIALVTLSIMDKARMRSFIKRILSSDTSATEIDKEVVHKCVRGKHSSHLMEVLFRVAPRSVTEEITMNCFLGNLVPLSLHPCANFFVQTLIDATCSPSLMSKLLQEIGPHMEAILQHNRTGVVVSLHRKSLQLGIGMEPCCQFLIGALKRSKTTNKRTNICEVLLCCGTKTVLGETFTKLSHKGCILLETLLHFPQETVQPFLQGMKALSDQSIQHMANDSCGGRILEQLFRNEEMPVKLKKSVLLKLESNWTQLAMSSSGSHLLEACFDFAKPDVKLNIQQSLEVNKAEICKTVWGTAAFKHCHITRSHSLCHSKSMDVQHGDKKRKNKAQLKPARIKKQSRNDATFVAPSYRI